MKTSLERWVETVIPDDYVIMGRRLNPFSIGHAIILNRLGNAFVDNDKVPGFTDLIEAVFVCSHDHADVRAALKSRWLHLKMWFWRRKAGKFHIGKAMDAFVGYMHSHSVVPDIKSTSDASSRVPGGPFLLRIKILLQSELGYSESEALSKPVGQAIWEVCALSEMKSERMQILNDDEMERTDEDVIAAFMDKLNREESGQWRSLN